jgi:hypothetical protein
VELSVLGHCGVNGLFVYSYYNNNNLLLLIVLLLIVLILTDCVISPYISNSYMVEIASLIFKRYYTSLSIPFFVPISDFSE